MSSNRERSNYNADKKRKSYDKQYSNGDEVNRHYTNKIKKSLVKDKSAKYKKYDIDEDI